MDVGLSHAVLAVGLSRVNLGLHYPSDVLGGYLAGAFWLGLITAALECSWAGLIRRSPG